MAYAWRSKWLDWKPGDEIISVFPYPALTELTKPQSVSFVSATPGNSQIISVPADNPAAWREPFQTWATSQCVFKDRCFGGISSLYVRFSEWCIAHDAVPCPRDTFERLLVDAGFLIADGLASGLILREDWQATHWKPEPAKAKPVHRKARCK